METKFVVRIISCSSDKYWYDRSIGMEFICLDHSSTDWYSPDNGFILKDDSKMINPISDFLVTSKGLIKELLPFNLLQALNGADVCQRDGKKIAKLAHFPTAQISARVVAVCEGPNEIPTPYFENGKLDDKGDSISDLFIYAEKIERFMNIYGIHPEVEGKQTCWYNSFNEAKPFAARDAIGMIKGTFTAHGKLLKVEILNA